MPTKRKGYAQISLLLPEALLQAVHAGRGGASVNAAICAAVAHAYGVPYTPPTMGRPRKSAPRQKPAPKRPRKGEAKS